MFIPNMKLFLKKKIPKVKAMLKNKRKFFFQLQIFSMSVCLKDCVSFYIFEQGWYRDFFNGGFKGFAMVDKDNKKNIYFMFFKTLISRNV